jgi:hypothetical protein
MQSREWIGGLLAVLLLAPLAAGAELLDDEPDNNALATAGTSIEPPNGTSFDADSGTFTLTPGDLDFVGFSDLETGDVLTAITTPLEDEHLETPDTVIALQDSEGTVLAEGTFGVNNDDESGRGLGALIRFEISSFDDYYIVVTGAGDTGYSGDHSEAGSYVLTLSVSHVGTDSATWDDEPANDSIGTAAFEMLQEGDALRYDTGIVELGIEDIDFYGLEALLPGDVVTAVTTPLDVSGLDDPDTTLGIFDSQGTLLATGDDSSDDDASLPNAGSVLRYRVGEGGDFFVGATGFLDVDFDGSHGEQGYHLFSLSVAEVPEPALARLVAAALVSLAALRRRSLL